MTKEYNIQYDCKIQLYNKTVFDIGFLQNYFRSTQTTTLQMALSNCEWRTVSGEAQTHVIGFLQNYFRSTQTTTLQMALSNCEWRTCSRSLHNNGLGWGSNPCYSNQMATY